MKTFLLSICLLLVALQVNAQSPVSWNCFAKKIADKTYEIHLTAKVSSPWHIYSQTTPDGGPVPTQIGFNKNPLVLLNDDVKEIGKLHIKHEEVFGVDVKYYDGGVDFVQLVTLRGGQSGKAVKTNINGTVRFMVCNDVQCLPPITEKFGIRIE